MGFCGKSKLVTTCILLGILVPLYISVPIALFVADQYAYYWYLNKAGLTYGPRGAGKADTNGTTGSMDEKDRPKLQWAQEKTAYLTLVMNVVGVATGTPATLIMGHVSDKYGRRFVLLWIMLSEGLHLGGQAIILMFSINAWALILPTILEGLLSGGLLSAIAQISACVVDIAKEGENSFEDNNTCNKREAARRWILLAVIDGTASLCLAAGTAIAGTMIHKKGFTAVSLASLAIFAPGVAFIYFLPETAKMVRQQNKNNIEERRAFFAAWNQLTNTLAQCRKTSVFRKASSAIILWFSDTKSLLVKNSPTVAVCIIILFLFSIAAMVDMHYGFLYLMGAPFYWNSELVGFFGGLSDALSAVFSMALVVITVICGWQFKSEETRTNPIAPSKSIQVLETEPNVKHNWTRHHSLLVLYLAIGLCLICLSKVAMAIAALFILPVANALLYTAFALRLTKSLPIPMIRALVAVSAHNNQHGHLYALCAFAQRIGLLISIAVLPLIYANTLAVFSGAVYVVCAILLAIGFMLTVFLPLTCKQYHEKNTEQPETYT